MEFDQLQAAECRVQFTSKQSNPPHTKTSHPTPQIRRQLCGGSDVRCYPRSRGPPQLRAQGAGGVEESGAAGGDRRGARGAAQGAEAVRVSRR